MILVITLAIVSSGLLQILALELVKKDVNTCRMLMNLQGLQPTILESALVEGGVPTSRAQLLRAVVRDPLVGAPTLSVDGHETPWQRVDLAQAVSAMRGPRSISAFDDTSRAKRPPTGGHFRCRGVEKNQNLTPTLHGSKKKYCFPCTVRNRLLIFASPLR